MTPDNEHEIDPELIWLAQYQAEQAAARDKPALSLFSEVDLILGRMTVETIHRRQESPVPAIVVFTHSAPDMGLLLARMEIENILSKMPAMAIVGMPGDAFDSCFTIANRPAYEPLLLNLPQAAVEATGRHKPHPAPPAHIRGFQPGTQNSRPRGKPQHRLARYGF